MALAYPLGECYFKRTGLNTPQPKGFHASDPEQFFKRMLVEFIWNKPAYHGAEAGDAVVGGKTLGLDIYSLVQLLSLPRQLRNGSPFQSRLLKLVSYTAIKSVPYEYRYSDKYEFSWPTVAKANFGVDVRWRPVELRPIQRSLMGIAFPVGWTLIRDPSAFLAEFRSMFPEVGLTAKFLPDLWRKLGLPSQGCTDSSVVGVSGPLGNISAGQKPPPDPEREASLQVFPGAKKPVALAEEHPKHETFLFHDIVMELLGADATWKPADENFEKFAEVAAGDPNAPELVHEKNEVIEFGNP
ncbi:hypothetical protein DL765_008382 [Monosporascus sp. GIB2]|nr:hypothetical protein DL765_008382 [Monosporascus sp. GIB2]